MKGQEALDAMRQVLALDAGGDHETTHVQADLILVALLRSLGYHSLVDAYESIVKWYA